MIANGDFLLRDENDIDYKDVKIGSQNAQELQDAFKKASYDSLKYILERLKDSFEIMVLGFKDIILISLAADLLVKVPLMMIDLEENDRPFKVL
eukprot:IDg12395t1